MRFSEQTLLDAVASPLFVLDIPDEGNPVYSGWNRAAALLSNISAEEVMGKTVLEVFPGRVGRMALDRHRVAATSGQIMCYDLIVPLPFGERQMRTTLSPLRGDDGRVSQLVGTTVDVTEAHHNALSQIRQSVDVKTIATEMEQFITMAAHDLQTPMRNVQILADRLRKDFQDLGDGKLEIIDLLEDVGIQATSLISDVLAYAHTTLGKTDEQCFDIAHLVEEVSAVIDPQERHHIESAHTMVCADKTVLQIVLRNLMDKAIMHCGDKCIRIGVTVQPGPEGQIQCTVRDDGKGFQDPTIAFLTGDAMHKGTGFGLLGIKQLILSRGGTISAAEPEQGSGAIVTLTLPGSVISAN